MVKTLTEVRPAVEGKFLAFLSYLSVFCIIPLIFKRNKPFIEHHGKQGLVLFVAQVIAFVGHIAVGYWFLSVSGLVLTGYAVAGFCGAVSGQYVRLWGVAGLAEKITL